VRAIALIEGHASISQRTGQLLRRTTTTSAAADSAVLVETGAALVEDTTIFGATSPVAGGRYRLAITPTFGDPSFTSITADYRRYLTPVRPFTVAVRFRHLGRYGHGSTDPRLLPLFFTLRDVVRGYGDTGRSAVTGGLSSSRRLLTGNVELRFPIAALLKRLTLASLPIEGLVFADSGRFALRWASDRAMLQALEPASGVNAAGLVFSRMWHPLDGRPAAGRSPSTSARASNLGRRRTAGNAVCCA
jgi:hypothetical protein